MRMQTIKREERRTFEKGRDDDHGRLNVAGDFRLAGHALQGGRADAAEAPAGADDRKAGADAGADAAPGQTSSERRRRSLGPTPAPPVSNRTTTTSSQQFQ